MTVQLTAVQRDALTELINIGVGRAAQILSAMVQTKVSLNVPSLRVMRPETAKRALLAMAPLRVSAVRLGYSGRFSGNAVLYFLPESAAALADVLVGEFSDVPDLDALKMGTITEVGNIMLNGVVGSISNILAERIQFRVPVYEEGIAHELITVNLGDGARVVVVAETALEVAQLRIHGETVLLLETDSFAILLEAIDRILAGQGGGSAGA
jgi:chemotaxis protein CheC